MTIPDFTDKIFDDPRVLRENLTKVLIEMNNNMQNVQPFPTGAIVKFPLTANKNIPDGYAKADGTNGTYDANTVQLINIQKK